MSKITAFDKPTIRLLRSDLDAALKAVGEKFGINLQTGNARFTSDNVTFKVEASLTLQDGTAVPKEASEFVRYAKLLGLAAEDLGRTFGFNGSTYKIVGAKTTSRKYPILAKNLSNGKTFKFVAADVARWLGNGVKVS
jgi:hypothetical protein